MDRTIVLKTNEGTGTNHNDLTYNYDFSTWEAGDYEISFSFSSNTDNLQNIYGYNLSVNFAGDYVKEANNVTAPFTYLGGLRLASLYYSSYINNYLIAKADSNPPIKIKKPTVSSINIRIDAHEGWGNNGYGWTYLDDYTLFLHFKKL